MRYAYRQSIAHAESPPSVGHPRIGPAPRERMQLVKLVWHEPAIEPALAPHDVLEARDSETPSIVRIVLLGFSGRTGKAVAPSL